MALVPLVLDGFPHFQEEAYRRELDRYMQSKQALIALDGTRAVGVLLFSYHTGSIDFMGIHPLYHTKGLPQAFLDRVMGQLLRDKTLTITTYRKGDKADTGHRRRIESLGFAEAELLVELGYPTQRFILPKEAADEHNHHNNPGGKKESLPAPPPIPLFPDEVAHLAWIQEKLHASLEEANTDVERLDQEYKSAKRYMAEYRGEIDPHEMFQNELALRDIDRTGAFAVDIRKRLEKLQESPYFARVDFRRKAGQEAVPYYIGRFSFTHENQMLIFDWRAPIASLFYDYQVGPAEYQAPVGTIPGELTRKRQFQVKNGKLEYALESGMQIQDDVLQRELSHTADEKMKTIITTIQKEQNQIIRQEKAGTMLIQGVAGSGKTSIALHRIAFLLYRFQDRLSARQVIILSPNKVFGDYIANVLPELGEEPIAALGFWELAQVQLEGTIGFAPEQDPLETEDAAWAERVAFKSTLDFVGQLDKFIAAAPTLFFHPTDYRWDRFSVTAEWIQARFLSYRSQPMKKRLALLAGEIHARFDSENLMGDSLPRIGAITKSLTAMLKIKTTLELYQQFYQWLRRPDLLVLPKKRTLEWEDVYPFLYLHGAFAGLKESRLMQHVVVDEMQDYTPIQYAVINRLFPCQKTLLGDFSQVIHPHRHQSLDQLQALYPEASLVQLLKSYRSTYEIITFARAIGQVNQLEPMERHGEKPKILSCAHAQEQLEKIQEQLRLFFQESDGFMEATGSIETTGSLGIIVKTNRAARDLYQLLSSHYEIHLISPDSTRFVNGCSITSVQMSKGLEFDQVLVPDVSEEYYSTPYDRSLLYIACTRAMHKLTLLHTGAPSPLLPPAQEEG